MQSTADILRNVELCIANLVQEDCDSALPYATQAAAQLKGMIRQHKELTTRPEERNSKRPREMQEVIVATGSCPGRFPKGPHLYVEGSCKHCKNSS